MASRTNGSGGHGEGTTEPGATTEAEPQLPRRTNDGRDLTDDVDKSDIYGGRSDVVGREDEVEGADEDAAG